MRGPMRRVTADEFIWRGALYTTLECGHSLRGRFRRDDGLPANERRHCPICGDAPEWALRTAGALHCKPDVG
jgi:hypothetical protein